MDVEAQRREKALALAERLREEENSPANDTLDREREARRAALEKRRVERERDLARKLQEVTAAADKGRAKEQAEEAAGAETLALIDQYRARISAKVRQRVVLPPDLRGNPEAVYEVTLLPGGEIADVRLRTVHSRIAVDLSQRRITLFRDGRVVLVFEERLVRRALRRPVGAVRREGCQLVLGSEPS